MGIVIRQTFYSTIWAYVGVVLGMVTTLWLFPHYLSATELGLAVGVLQPLMGILSQFALLGSVYILFNYSAKYKDDEHNRPRFLFFSFCLAIIGFAIVSLVYIIGKPFFVTHYAEHSPLFISYYWYVLPFTFFYVLYAFFEGYARSQKDTVFTNFTREVMLRIFTIIGLFLFIAGWLTYTGFITFYVLTYGMILLLLFIYFQNKKWWTWSWQTNFGTLKEKQSMVQYGIYSMLGGSGWALTASIDSLMIAAICVNGLENAAVYRLAIFITAVIQMPQRTMVQILIPLLSGHWLDNDLKKIEDLYRRTSLQLLIFGTLLLILVMVNMDSFLQLLPPIYSDAKWVVFVAGASKLFDMMTSINGEIIQTSTRYKFNLYLILLLMVFTIIANYILIPLYGIMGAAVAMMAVTFVYNFIKFIFVWKCFKIQPFTKGTPIVLLLAVIVTAIIFWLKLNTGNIYFDITIRSIIASIIFVLPLVAFKISPDINNIINQLFSKFKINYRI